MSLNTIRQLPAYRPIIILLLLLGSVIFFFGAVLPIARGLSFGFPGYYAPARLIVEGRWSTQIYDDSWYSAQVLAMTDGRISEKFSPHPPSTALLALPLAGFDLVTARNLWLILNAVWLGAGVLFLNFALKRVPGISFGWETLVLALWLTPLAENFRLGQAYVLLFFLFALAYWGLVQERIWFVGVGLGTAAIFKLSGGPVWLVLAARGQWRELAASAAVGFGFFVLTGLVLGWETWFYFFSILPPYLSGPPQASHLAFQTTPSFSQHLFVADAQWNPMPLIHQPLLAPLMTWFVTLASLGVTSWQSRRAPLDLAFAAAMVLGVVLFPIAEEYHYSLMLLPLAIAGARLLLGPFNGSSTVLYLVAVLMLALPLPYKSESLNHGWYALLAYPRLYGGWLLWLWLLRQMWLQNAAATRTALPSNATR